MMEKKKKKKKKPGHKYFQNQEMTIAAKNLLLVGPVGNNGYARCTYYTLTIIQETETKPKPTAWFGQSRVSVPACTTAGGCKPSN